jgi:ABC-type molybdate transport system substrate-binding protein
MKTASIIAAASALLLSGMASAATMFSAGIHAGAKQAEAAKALVKFITAPAAASVIKKHGLEPA